ncbi:hypothetical protein SAMN04487897_103302 [Paenibacillus sp. yr247]|uniref:hypothetical protein n=1 Tax=Paenibacillus sp. yr247 TaxID=1761880 RepID=UPI00088389A5|nr:hypothetical protein [Paenibacillus sp. yr247]SDN60192.1 hypothetical protein SAMN04487897_103302 [Paenibacillus sp. yr247]
MAKEKVLKFEMKEQKLNAKTAKKAALKEWKLQKQTAKATFRQEKDALRARQKADMLARKAEKPK